MNQSHQESRADRVLWALSPLAIEAFSDLVVVGLDRDLALALLEQLLTDEQLYEFPEE